METTMATKTKRMMGLTASAALLSALAFAAEAQGPSDTSLEVTIRLLPENAVGPAEITKEIELPPAAANAAAPPADPAGGPPPGAERGNGQGLDVAAEARERGREYGQDVAEQARENRENAGRPDDAGPPVDPPGGPNDPPGPPITPPGRP
jgi:hypothetical protein